MLERFTPRPAVSPELCAELRRRKTPTSTIATLLQVSDQTVRRRLKKAQKLGIDVGDFPLPRQLAANASPEPLTQISDMIHTARAEAKSATPMTLFECGPRLKEVVLLTARARTKAEIADELFVTVNTVRTHLHYARRVAKARNNVQLVAHTYEVGFVVPGAIDHPGIERILTLTKRQWEVTKLITQGMSSPAISADLGIAPATVRTHRAQALHAVGEHRAVWLAVLGYESGLLPIADSVKHRSAAARARQNDPEGPGTS